MAKKKAQVQGAQIPRSIVPQKLGFLRSHQSTIQASALYKPFEDFFQIFCFPENVCLVW